MGKKWRHAGLLEKNDGQIVQCEVGAPHNKDIDENVVALRVVTVGMRRWSTGDWNQAARHNSES